MRCFLYNFLHLILNNAAVKKQKVGSLERNVKFYVWNLCLFSIDCQVYMVHMNAPWNLCLHQHSLIYTVMCVFEVNFKIPRGPCLCVS